jgi:hypothetical protein
LFFHLASSLARQDIILPGKQHCGSDDHVDNDFDDYTTSQVATLTLLHTFKRVRTTVIISFCAVLVRARARTMHAVVRTMHAVVRASLIGTANILSVLHSVVHSSLAERTQQWQQAKAKAKATATANSTTRCAHCYDVCGVL